jgi:hypothetical protein
MPITRRQARRKLGSRTTRRANTNGKLIFGTNKGGKTRTVAYKYPKKRRNRVAARVGKLLTIHGERVI